MIRKINNSNLNPAQLGWVTHQQGSITFQSAQQAAAAVTSGPGSAAGCSPHPFSTFLLPLCPISSTSWPHCCCLRWIYQPAASSPECQWAEHSTHACGTWKCWHFHLFQMALHSSGFLKYSHGKEKRNKYARKDRKKWFERRKEEGLEKCQESTAMGKSWGCLAQGNFPAWVWAEQGFCSLGATSSYTGLQVIHQPVFTAITPRTGLIYLFW